MEIAGHHSGGYNTRSWAWGQCKETLAPLRQVLTTVIHVSSAMRRSPQSPQAQAYATAWSKRACTKASASEGLAGQAEGAKARTTLFPHLLCFGIVFTRISQHFAEDACHEKFPPQHPLRVCPTMAGLQFSTSGFLSLSSFTQELKTSIRLTTSACGRQNVNTHFMEYDTIH